MFGWGHGLYFDPQDPNLQLTAEVLANAAAILTAIIAMFFFVQFHLGRRWKRQRLERYLKKQREAALAARAAQPTVDLPEGKHSLLHLLEHVGMTEAELVDASFRSKVIERHTGRDRNGMAVMLMLMYNKDKGQKG